MSQHGHVASLLVLAVLLVVGCAQGELQPAPSSDAPLEPQVWLPEDGLPVPASVVNRAPLHWCGVAVAIEGGVGPGDQLESSRCIIAALRAGAAAEMVVDAWTPRTARSTLFIIRTRPDATEVVQRSTAPGLPPLWEVERCASAKDRRMLHGDTGEGREVGDLLIPDCAALTPILD